MASSSMIMLSNVSMERLYLSQPPAWNEIQRLSFPHNQQQDGRSSQQLLRTCYDKLLHHMYDINSSTSSSTTINQINEQLELAAEYCQLKTLRDGNTVYLHLDAFHLEITFDPITHLPINMVSCIANEEHLICPTMLKALNEKQYKLFRKHLNGYTSLFTLTAPNMNNDKRIGYTSYKILQQDLERLAKTEMYGKLLEGFQPIFEGLPMRIKLDHQSESNSSLPVKARIIIVPSANQHFLPIKSAVHLDEKTNTIQLDSSMKSHTLATGHFALEFDENQPPLLFLLPYAQDISRLTNISSFLSQTKPCNYLSSILPKPKAFDRYQWYLSHDQQAIFVRQIPFTNLQQLVHLLTLIRQQIYLTKYLNLYFYHQSDSEHMDDDDDDIVKEISLELSFLSSTILSITCAQSYHLSTFLLQMSNINTLPLLINRQQEREVYLTDERNSLFKLIENLLKEDKPNDYLSTSLSSSVNLKSKYELEGLENQLITAQPLKFNRRLSCGPPAKPTWRRATTLRRNQPACLTLATTQEQLPDEQSIEEEITQNPTTDEFNDEDDAFFQSSPAQTPLQQIQHSSHPQLLPRPSLTFHPSTLSRCTSVSSTQSISTPPIFGLSPSTPYPGGSNNPNGNIFFPLGKQVSVPEYSPVSSPMPLGTLDPLVFLPADSMNLSTNDTTNKNPQKKKRRRSDTSADDFIQTLSNDNRSPIHSTKLASAGGDPSNIKRGKKSLDKTAQQQQLVRQKSAFKVTDSSSTGLLSQQSATLSDDTSNELKPLKVVIKRVEGSGTSSTDDSQQQAMKQRKKQQQMANNPGNLPGATRKLPNNNSAGSASPSVLVKSESLDMSQFNSESNSMMTINDGMQQISRERPRPSSSLSNPSTSLTSSSSQPRSAPPQPPIVLKIQRSKVYPGQDSSSSSTSTTTTAVTPVQPPTTNTIQSTLKEALKHRPRSIPSGSNTNKQNVTSPPILAAKLTSPSTTAINNPLAPSPSVTSLFRIPRKSSSQEVSAKPKAEPATNHNNPSPVPPKPTLMPGPGIRPSLPPSQIGSWQSPPTQQPSRFHQNRPRSSWSQQQQPPRGRTSVTPPNVSAMNSGPTSFVNLSQQPRSILKKPLSNENTNSDLLFMPPSALSGLNEQRTGMNYPVPPPSSSRTSTSPGMYDDNDDDSSPQAQLVIDTSSNPTNNVLLPYTIVPGSSSSLTLDNYDQNHENNSMMHSSQGQLTDEAFSNLD